MATKIVHVQGRLTGTEHWVEHEVVRVGSGRQCEIQIPELAEHAFTLQFRNGQYCVFNRCQETLSLSGQQIRFSEAAVWRIGTDLRVGNLISLRLQANSNETPAPRPFVWHTLAEDEDPSSPAEAEDPTQVQQRQRRQITLLCLSLLGTAIFLFSGSKSSQIETPNDRYESLISQLQLNVPDSDCEMKAVRTALRRAFCDEGRSRFDDAVSEYLFARDHLAQRQGPDGNYSSNLESETMDFIQERIRVLGR
jgi:hypothetical protein